MSITFDCMLELSKKSKEYPKKLRKRIFVRRKQGIGYKNTAKALNVPRDTISVIVHKFNTGYITWRWQNKETINGQIPKKAG